MSHLVARLVAQSYLCIAEGRTPFITVHRPLSSASKDLIAMRQGSRSREDILGFFWTKAEFSDFLIVTATTVELYARAKQASGQRSLPFHLLRPFRLLPRPPLRFQVEVSVVLLQLMR